MKEMGWRLSANGCTNYDRRRVGRNKNSSRYPGSPIRPFHVSRPVRLKGLQVPRWDDSPMPWVSQLITSWVGVIPQHASAIIVLPIEIGTVLTSVTPA
jgi:hypothetical protein